MAKVEQARAAGKPMTTTDRYQMFVEDAVVFQAKMERAEKEKAELPPGVMADILGTLETGQFRDAFGNIRRLSISEKPGETEPKKIRRMRIEAVAFAEGYWSDPRLTPNQRKQIFAKLDEKYPAQDPKDPKQQLSAQPSPTEQYVNPIGPTPGATAIPAVKDRVVGQTYTINGKLYEWQLKGWVKK